MKDKINTMTGDEAKSLLNSICDIFSIGSDARTANIILSNVNNLSEDLFCRHKRVLDFLEGKTFRLIKSSGGYYFTRPGAAVDTFGNSIRDAVESAMRYEEEKSDG